MKQLTYFAILCVFLGMIGGYIGNELTIIFRRRRYNRKGITVWGKKTFISTSPTVDFSKLHGKIKADLFTWRVCNSCEGSGIIKFTNSKSNAGPSVITCDTCDGSGKIKNK